MIFDKFWRKPGNVAYWDKYSGVLKRPKVLKDMKNFHICNIFFKHIIDVNVISLVMKKNGQKYINNF